MAADPYPFDDVVHQLRDRTMMIAYAYRETVTSPAFELLEIERRVMVIAFPKFLTLFRARPNMRGKRIMKFPKATGAF